MGFDTRMGWGIMDTPDDIDLEDLILSYRGDVLGMWKRRGNFQQWKLSTG